jgi:hypothetical protein
MKKRSHREKLEKKRWRLIKKFNRHELSRSWSLDTRIASNKIHLTVTRQNKYGQPVWKKLSVGLKDNVKFNTFLKI